MRRITKSELDLVRLQLLQERRRVDAGDAHGLEEERRARPGEALEPVGPGPLDGRRRLLLERAPDLPLAERHPGDLVLPDPLDEPAHGDLLHPGREEPTLEENEDDDPDGDIERGELGLLACAALHDGSR
jgi:hypothetical protein